MQRGGRTGGVSDWSAGRIHGRSASRAAWRQQAVDDQMGEGMFFAGDEYAGDEVTSGPYSGLDDPDADDYQYDDLDADVADGWDYDREYDDNEGDD